MPSAITASISGQATLRRGAPSISAKNPKIQGQGSVARAQLSVGGSLAGTSTLLGTLDLASPICGYARLSASFVPSMRAVISPSGHLIAIPTPTARLAGLATLSANFDQVAELAGQGSLAARLGPVARLMGTSSLNARGWPAQITLAGRATVSSLLAARMVASMAGVATLTKKTLKGRAPLQATLSGIASMNNAALHGKCFSQGRATVIATLRATASTAATIAGVGDVTGLLTGAWYARGHASLTASLSGRLRDAYLHQIVRRYRQGTFGGEIQGLETLTGNVELLIQQKFAGGSLNVPLGVSFHSANLVSVGILSDHAVTLYFNDPATGFLTINAEQPIVWSTASPSAAPFTGNIDELYLTNAGTVPANFTLNLLLQE